MFRLAARLTATILLASVPAAAAGQTFEMSGTRPAGLGGAFVAVADDASAAYWNPAGFASGSYFSLVLDRTSTSVEPDQGIGSAARSGLLIAMGFPALGLSYYRLRGSTAVTGLPSAPEGHSLVDASRVRIDTLITHHTGATLVQTLVPGLGVGATFKIVRGVASSISGPVEAESPEAIDPQTDFVGKASTRFDVDFGVMGTLGRIRAGLTLRNLTEPSFRTAGTRLAALKLQRHARLGVAVIPHTGWLIATDLDLTKTEGAVGDERIFALGAEGGVATRVTVRAGFRLNTAADRERDGTAAGISAGGTYAVSPSLLMDAQVTGGPERAGRGWGLAGRFVY